MKTAAHASIAGRTKFLIDTLLIAIAKTDDAEAARFGHRLCQCSTGRSSHRGKKNRMADAELFGELCAKRHRVCPFHFVVCVQPRAPAALRHHRKGNKLIRVVPGAPTPPISNKLLGSPLLTFPCGWL